MEEAAHSLLIAYDKSHARRAKQVSRSDTVGVEVLVLKFSRNSVLDLELVQRLDRCDPAVAPQVLATAAPLLCGGTWAALVALPDRVLFQTSRAPALRASDLAPLAHVTGTCAVEVLDGCPAGSGPTQLAVVALPPDGALLVARTGREPFSPAELTRLRHLAEARPRSAKPASTAPEARTRSATTRP